MLQQELIARTESLENALHRNANVLTNCMSSFICKHIALTLAMHYYDVNADIRPDGA